MKMLDTPTLMCTHSLNTKLTFIISEMLKIRGEAFWSVSDWPTQWANYTAKGLQPTSRSLCLAYKTGAQPETCESVLIPFFVAITSAVVNTLSTLGNKQIA